MTKNQYMADWAASVVTMQEVKEQTPLRISLKNPFSRRQFLVPDVTLVGSGGTRRLAWTSDLTHQVVGNPVDAFVAFVQLAEKPDEEIARFAAKWGPLGICQHGMPYTHADSCIPLHVHSTPRTFEDIYQSSAASLEGGPIEATSWIYWEPLSSWRYFSRYFRDVLQIAVALQHGRQPSPREWFWAFPWHRIGLTEDVFEALLDGEPYPPDGMDELLAGEIEESMMRDFNLSGRDGRKVFSAWVKDLLQDGRVRPTLEWRQTESPEMTLEFGRRAAGAPAATGLSSQADSTFSILTASMVALAMNVGRVENCSACGGPVIWKRKPRVDQNIYCDEPECRRKGANERSKKSMAKKRASERKASANSFIGSPVGTPVAASNGEQE